MNERRAIVAAALLSVGLCLAGNRWGLPARFHPDEKADVVAAMVREHRALPDSYVNPSLPLLLAAPVVAAQQALGARLGEPWSDPLLAVRALSALATGLAVWLLGWAASRAPGSGAIAALLLALAPGVVNFGHFATPEAWLLATTALVLLLATRHVDKGTPAWMLGLALGLAASTKYTAAALAVPTLAALWLRKRDPAARADRWTWLAAGGAALAVGLLLAGSSGRSLAEALHLPDVRLLHPESARVFVHGLATAALATGASLVALAGLAALPQAPRFARRIVRREVVVAGLAAAAGFLLGTPGALLEPRAFLSDLAFNAQTRHEYKGLVGEATSFAAYLQLAADALTVPLLLTALAGLALVGWRVRRGERTALVVALAAVAPYLLLASSGHRAMRFLAVALPASVWLTALVLAAIPRRGLRLVFVAAVAARAAVAALLVVRLFFVDSRLRAEAWLLAHVPAGATVDVITNHEGYVPHVPDGRNARTLRTLSREMAPAERFLEAARAFPAEAGPWLVLTGAFYERFLDNPDQMPERTRFFHELLEGRGGFEVAARFRQQGWLRPPAEFLDPEIVVLRRTGPPPSPGGAE